jgi:hypothetical protein
MKDTTNLYRMWHYAQSLPHYGKNQTTHIARAGANTRAPMHGKRAIALSAR